MISVQPRFTPSQGFTVGFRFTTSPCFGPDFFYQLSVELHKQFNVSYTTSYFYFDGEMLDRNNLSTAGRNGILMHIPNGQLICQISNDNKSIIMVHKCIDRHNRYNITDLFCSLVKQYFPQCICLKFLFLILDCV